MLNHFTLVGRIVKIEEKKEEEKESVIVTVATPQSFKNKDGIYETDFIDCRLYKEIAKSVKEYCKVGDLIGIKGRLQTLGNDKQLIIVAEQVSFLSSQSSRKDEE